jgi:hypothetical protein
MNFMPAIEEKRFAAEAQDFKDNTIFLNYPD